MIAPGSGSYVTELNEVSSSGEQQHHVCVVDDDESICRALARLLRLTGYEVHTYCDGREFLASTEPERADCVVLDVRMPGLDGLEIQEALVRSGSSVAVVFISGHDDESAEALALSRGAVAFFHKPFDEEALLASIAAAVEGAHPGSSPGNGDETS